MKLKTIFTMLVLSIALIGGVFASGIKPEKEFKWVLTPASDSAAEMERYGPIAAYLGEQIGFPVKLVMASSGTAAFMSLKSGDSQMAKLSNLIVVLADTMMVVDPIIRGVKKSTGVGAYSALIIVRADSGLKNIADLEGKIFAYVSETSTSGYLVPQLYFSKNNINPEW